MKFRHAGDVGDVPLDSCSHAGGRTLLVTVDGARHGAGIINDLVNDPARVRT